MKTLHAIVILFLSVLMSGCAPVTVTYDYNTDVDFSALKRYSWLEVPADFPANEITIQRIKNEVDRQLEIKGFEQVSESPDFLVSILGFKDVVRQGVATGSAYSAYPGYRGYHGYSGSQQRVDVYEFEEGTLTVTIINAARSTLIWEGTATGILEPGRSTEYKEKKTQETIARLLANFPPMRK